MEGLERCPFCGGEAREFIDAAVVGCMRCPAEVRGESPAEAVAAWNRRASDAALAKAREALDSVATDLELRLEADPQRSPLHTPIAIARDALSGTLTPPNQPGTVVVPIARLREIEWVGDDDPSGQSATCVVCKYPEWASATSHGHHAPDCWLDAAIHSAESNPAEVADDARDVIAQGGNNGRMGN